MHHGVARDRVGEARQLIRRGQLAVQQQIGDFHEARLFGEFADRIAAMQQNAFVAVDIDLHLVRDAAEAFLFAEQREHVENAGRGLAPGESGAERLGDLSELCARAVRHLPYRCFDCLLIPLLHRVKRGVQRSEERTGIGGQQVRSCLIHRERPDRKQESGAVAQFVEIGGARLQHRHRAREQIDVGIAADLSDQSRQPRIVGSTDRDGLLPTASRSNHSVACSRLMISSSPWPQPRRSR
ncbi:hypothetical protein WR25_15890 [Diploscapter pachys]|uniref:Uncharacterized protein n=1 Tax=Diploscapter pachys TaxID=2018661 RepID=A0A2A2M3R3_9BILA|nr:hypothetical protein WR25_15890 [Diploscapter pachys]